MAGRVPVDGSKSFTGVQWRSLGAVVGEVDRAALNFG
jgi:hypothetical protein